MVQEDEEEDEEVEEVLELSLCSSVYRQSSYPSNSRRLSLETWLQEEGIREVIYS